MGQDLISHDAALIRGRAWHVYPDPATPGVLAGDNPFGTDEAPAPDRGDPKLPAGVGHFWLLNKNAPGIQNSLDGHSYLVLTDSADSPAVAEGWNVEVARLDESFQVDQRGDRWLRLVRVIGTAHTPLGPLMDCEFQVDRA